MPNHIDIPAHNDNRKYEYGSEYYMRHEFPIIAEWVTKGASIIDLGCGNGALIQYLQKYKNVHAEGVEIAKSGVDQCIANGLTVQHASIDDTAAYARYQNKQFEYAICNVTLQMVGYPEVLLSEMKRVSKKQIISIPNFAYLSNRLDLLFHGVMPRPMLHGYTWYNTGHIHQLSVKDFKRFCVLHGMKILRRKDFGFLSKAFFGVFPNVLAKESIFLLEGSE